MKTLRQILNEFSPSEEEDGGDHSHGYTLGSMTDLFLHNIEGEKTGHKGFITTSEGHAVSVHHNISGQQNSDPMVEAPSDDIDEPVSGHTSVHSVLRNGMHVGNLYVHHNDYGGHFISVYIPKKGTQPGNTADMRPSGKSTSEYNKLWTWDDQMKKINPEDKGALGRLAEASRLLAQHNFPSLMKKIK